LRGADEVRHAAYAERWVSEMKTKNLSFLEKLPMYLVAYSVPFVFFVIAAISLGFYPYTFVVDAALKSRSMLIVFIIGTLITICWCTIHSLKKHKKVGLIHLSKSLLLDLAYFTFYFGLNKIVVVGICIIGITDSILSILKLRKKPTASARYRKEKKCYRTFSD
jgi:Na+/melibiose symporter-like transporter